MKEVRRFPGLAEWLVAFASTALIAVEVQGRGDLMRLQSSSAYYFDSPWVKQIHLGALVIDGLMIGLVAIWFLSRLRGWPLRLLPIVAGLGFLLCWGELLYALRLQEGAIYVLMDLPFRPVNNGGVIGAQVFGTYLILRIPNEKLKGWRVWLVGAGLSLALWFFQVVLWQIVVPK